MTQPLWLRLVACFSMALAIAAESAWPDADPAELQRAADSLEQARDYALSAGGSGLVVCRDQVVIRWGDQEKRYDIKSATKSFGAVALGLAIGDGRIDLDAPALRYHPQLGVPPESNRANGWLEEITIRHLATHTAGFEKPGGFGKLLARPGTRWIYSDGGPNWLADCLTVIYRKDIEDLMFERVFEPLGLTRKDLRWRRNSYRPAEIDGLPRREFGSGVHANVEALARMGYLHLRGGEWNGRRILDREFVRLATRPIQEIAGLPELDESHGNASEHYGLLWWNNGDGTLPKIPKDAFWAWGLYDSLIVVIPSLDLVIARCGESGKSWPRKKGADHYEVLKPFLEPIVAAASDRNG